MRMELGSFLLLVWPNVWLFEHLFVVRVAIFHSFLFIGICSSY